MFAMNCTYCVRKVKCQRGFLNIVPHISLIIREKKNASNCCDSPDAKDLSVIARHSTGGISLLKIVSFFLILGPTRFNK